MISSPTTSVGLSRPGLSLALADKITIDRLRILCENLPLSILGGIPLSLAMAWMMSTMVSHQIALWWLIGKSLTALPRLVHVVYLMRRTRRGHVYQSAQEAQQVLNVLRALVLFDGLAWGAAAWLCTPASNLDAAVVMLGCLLGLASVAAYALAVDFLTMACFVLPILGPNVPFCLTRPDVMGSFGVAAMSGFTVVLLLQGWRVQQRVQELLTLRFENEAIAQERELALAQARLHSDAKSRFLATVSHEMRTPLHGMLGLARLLQHEHPRPEQRQRLGLIERSGEHLLLVINDVLDFSKIEAGRMEIQHHPFDLSTVLQESAGVFQVLAQRKKLTLTLTLGWDGPCVVQGDAGRVRQVLHNLLGNAVKFTEHGSVHLLAQRQPDTDHFEITVRDTGPGIALHEQPLIFEAFTQAQSNLNRSHGGTGLGLSIARQLCQGMGGGLTLESAPGLGAVFKARIHCPAVVSDAADPVSPPHAAYADSGWLHVGARVLLVEDNPVNVLVAEAMLRNLGHEVCTVNDGLQAVAWLDAEQCDVVLMDCAMPVMDGFEAAREIRRRERQGGRGRVPIVALTANVLADEREQCLHAGMDDYLAKPFEPDDIQRVVERCMANAPLMRAL
jgi:signal transduction histidine kinase/ActR/RegA family two-component response regulator